MHFSADIRVPTFTGRYYNRGPGVRFWAGSGVLQVYQELAGSSVTLARAAPPPDPQLVTTLRRQGCSGSGFVATLTSQTHILERNYTPAYISRLRQLLGPSTYHREPQPSVVIVILTWT